MGFRNPGGLGGKSPGVINGGSGPIWGLPFLGGQPLHGGAKLSGAHSFLTTDQKLSLCPEFCHNSTLFETKKTPGVENKTPVCAPQGFGPHLGSLSTGDNTGVSQSRCKRIFGTPHSRGMGSQRLGPHFGKGRTGGASKGEFSTL